MEAVERLHRRLHGISDPDDYPDGRDERQQMMARFDWEEIGVNYCSLWDEAEEIAEAIRNE